MPRSERRKELDRIYRKTHREQRRAYYWQNREYALKYARAYREKHRDEIYSKLRERYQHNKGEINKRAKMQRQLVRIEVLSHYADGSPKCAVCNECDDVVLCIDHIAGSGNQHRKLLGGLFGHRFYVWLKTNGYPEGFQVLCYNCNQRKKHYKGEV